MGDRVNGATIAAGSGPSAPTARGARGPEPAAMAPDVRDARTFRPGGFCVFTVRGHRGGLGLLQTGSRVRCHSSVCFAERQR